MANAFADVTAAIGRTPLIRLSRIDRDLPGNLYGKLESRNPAGSIKDRIARAMVAAAEDSGQLKPGQTLVEPTSGNTGIALAMVAAARGYRLKLTMPESMSPERISLLRAYGADVELTPGTLMSGAVQRAAEIRAEDPDAVMLQQFENPANPAIHEATTGPEIYEDLDGEVGAFVAGVGTGGTITGVGHYLRKKGSKALICAVEPQNAAVLSGGRAGPHYIQGIGAGFIPPILDRKVIDEIIPIRETEAFDFARAIAKQEGLLVGISSGAGLAAATAIAKRKKMKDKNVVVVLCDGGERYLSTPLFTEMFGKAAR